MEERDFNLLIVQARKRDADFLVRPHCDLRIIEWVTDLRRTPLKVEKWDTPIGKINSFCGVFSSVNWLMGHSQPLFKRAVIRCFEKNKVFEGSLNFPNFSQIFNEIDRAAKDLKLDGYEHRNTRDHLKFVLYSFIETGEILDSKNGITIEDFISQEDIILNVKDEDSDYVVSTVIIDIFKDLQRYYEKYPVYPPRLRTLIVVDECRRVFPPGDSNSQYNQNHNPHAQMETFVTTRRACGIGIIAITQEPQSSPSWLTDNCAFVLAFPIGGKARDHVKQLLNLTDEENRYIDDLPEKGTGIFRDRRFNRRYLLQIPGNLRIEPITVDETAKIMRSFIDRLHAQLNIEADEAPEPIDLNQMEQQANNQKIGILILWKLKENPFLHYTQLITVIKKDYGFSKKNAALALDWLKNHELITTEKARASKTKDAEYYSLTRKAQVSLDIPETVRISPSHFKHTLYSERVKDYLISDGHEAIREYTEGEPEVTISTKSGKDIKIPKRIDVLAIKEGKKIAYEITLSFSNLLANIYKCLKIFKVDELHIVCERQDKDLDKAMNIVSEKVPAYLLERITFDTMTRFF